MRMRVGLLLGAAVALCALGLGAAFSLPARPAAAAARPPRRLGGGAARGAIRPPAARVGGAAARMSTATTETYAFEAEVSRVMDIIINSLYSNKDIFLRELVSNASDACDKKRVLGLTGEAGSAEEEGGLCIRVKADKEARTITIEDKGVGMTRDELRENLGTIAQSGTKRFLEALKAQPDSTNLIGQFGVGFYSSYLVADRVSVVTKAQGGEQLRWESAGDGTGSYTIGPDEGGDPIEGSSGTRVVLQLKEDADDYLEPSKLRALLGTYSEYISFPVELWASKTEYEQVVDEDAEVGEGEPPKMKTVPKESEGWEHLNTAKPLWMRPAAEVSADEYAEFYKTAFRAWDEPVKTAHFSLEGQVEFRALLFVPKTLPWELTQDMFGAADGGAVKLYVKRIFISDKFSGEILPRWLSFMRAIVDSEDLPLNVSRELLQRSKVLSIISKRLVRKALDLLNELASDAAEYAAFYEQFGKYIKVGLIEDRDNKDELLALARFSSSRAAVAAAGGAEAGSEDEAKADAESGAGALTSLEEYVSRMPEGQKQIYYIAGTSAAALAASPALERLSAAGREVLFALDSVDEIALQGVGKYKDFEVVDAAKQNADLGELSDEEGAEAEVAAETFKPALEFLKESLADAVSAVEVSRRLTTSPAAIVQPQWGMSPQMERFMKAQAVALGQEADIGSAASTAVLEVNPKHPALGRLLSMVESSRDAPETKEYAQLMYDVAAVTSGYEIKDPAAFAKRITRLMTPDADAAE